MTTLAEIAAQLSEPFALEDIDFLPKGKIERDNKTLCMALPYADPRVYQDRLNALCPGEWSTPTPTALTVGNKLVCYVTVVICGVPHSDVGEADPGENQGTEAWAQGFKRACSQATLGRYLYNLEKEWVPFNVQRKQIDLDKAGKQAIVKKMYQKAGIVIGQVTQEKPKQLAAPVTVEPASNGHQAEPPIPINAPTPRELRERHKFLQMNDDFDTIVKKMFKRSMPDDALSPEMCIDISGVLERFYEKQAKSA